MNVGILLLWILFTTPQPAVTQKKRHDKLICHNDSVKIFISMQKQWHFVFLLSTYFAAWQHFASFEGRCWYLLVASSSCLSPIFSVFPTEKTTLWLFCRAGYRTYILAEMYLWQTLWKATERWLECLVRFVVLSRLEDMKKLWSSSFRYNLRTLASFGTWNIFFFFWYGYETWVL